MYRVAQSIGRLEKEILSLNHCEQRRIGRELHNGLCQELAGLSLLIHSMQQRINKDERLDMGDFADLASLALSALRHARCIARGLDPVAAEPQGLSVALQQLAADTTANLKVPCTFHHPQPVDVQDPLTATHLYRIAQDAVCLAIRDCGATSIFMELSQDPHGIRLAIGDNGAQGPGKCDIRRIMKQRARMIAATLAISTDPKATGAARVVCRLADGRRFRTGGCDENGQTDPGWGGCEGGGAGKTPRVPGRRSRHRPPRAR